MPATGSPATAPTTEERASDVAHFISPVALFLLPLTVEGSRWLAFGALSLLLGAECVPGSAFGSAEPIPSQAAASPAALLMAVRDDLAEWIFLFTALAWLPYVAVKLLMIDEYKRRALRKCDPLLLGLFVLLVAMEAVFAALVCASL